WAETYNVYDKKGRLCFVIPPLALEEYNTPGFGDPAPPYGFYLVETTTNFADVEVASEGKIAYTSGSVIHVNKGDVLEKGDIIQSYDPADQVGQPADFHLSDLIFQYRYDHRHRLIEKRVPGADWVYMVYDDRNRLVLTQDGNQRASNKWSFVKYDQLNRSIITGEKVISGTVDAIRTAVANATVFYETYDAAELMNYTNLAYPAGITADDIYSVSYYDNYDFTSKTFSLPANVFTDLSDHRETPAQTTHALKGLATGAKTKVLGTTTFLETVNFYDDKYRVVQSISENHKGGRDITTVQYNFAGQVMKTYVDHNPDGAANNSTTIEQAYTYDHVGRSLTTTHSIDNATPVTIASYTYNELGALENKTLADGFEDVDYEYNIRGWITQMNNPNDSEDHLFEMEFKYETATNKQYNGNIGEVAWKNPYESTTSSFDYTYDEMNRLKTADYDNTGTSTRDYGLESISYDANSNIKTLKRKGDHDDTANQSFDDLTYDYDGNRLMAVTDNAAMDTGFKNGVDDTIEYSYDANGNLTADKNKGITSITYNHINQPTRVTYDAGKYIEYSYSASGAKVSQTVVENGTSTTTDYLGGFLYQENKLQIIAHSQGRVVAEYDVSEAFQGYEYQYHLTDHLGNVRVTFKTAIETDNYLATVETDSASLERPYFYNLDSTRYTHALANHTANGDEVSRIGQDSLHLIGPAIALKVVPGDTIDMEVWAYYEGGTGYNNTVTLATFIDALAGAFGGSSTAGGEAGAIFDGVNDALLTGAGGIRGTGDDGVPGAYLSYILFDQNYEEIQNGYHEISSSANLLQERLYLDDITVSEPGYLYIYTSMQSNANQPVYFDDLKVSHTHSPVVQKDDYLPFGLSFNSYSRAAITAQNFKFNGGSELEEMTDWYMTPFRKYDPSLGRFHGEDALADLMPGITPSHFGYNNPIMTNDPTGLLPPTSGWDDDDSFGGDSGITNDSDFDPNDCPTCLPELVIEDTRLDPAYSSGMSMEIFSFGNFGHDIVIQGSRSGGSQGGHRGPLLGGIMTYQTTPLPPPALPPALLPVPVATNSNSTSTSSIQLDNGNFDTVDWLNFYLSRNIETLGSLGSGALGTAQIGMLEHRRLLSVQDKIGTFAKFRGAYKGIGIASRTLGRGANVVGAPVTFYLDYNAHQTGQISETRFTYRTTGLGLSIIGGAAIGATYGGPWGAAGGALISLGSVAGEAAYDGLNWLWNETSQQIYNFQNALKYGWYPGR
ncbi:RHS repeat-associated core domain-containing protein, partial [Reichenbachiella sp.]